MSARKFMPTKMIVNKITTNDITGKSLSQTALTAADPSPGQANTVSTTTTPVMNPATNNAE